MAKPKRKQSKKPTLMQLFIKEYRRLWKGILAAKRRGYLIDYNPLPEIPKRVRREQLVKIQSKKPKDFLKEFARLKPDTGEIIQAKNPNEKKRKKALESGKGIDVNLSELKARTESLEQKKKQEEAIEQPISYEPEPKESKTPGQKLKDGEYTGIQTNDGIDWGAVYIDTFRTQFAAYRPTVLEMIDNWLSSLISKYGEEPVGQMIADAAANGALDFNSKWAYDPESMHEYLSGIIMFMEDAGSITAEDFMNALEEDEVWEDFRNG